MTSGPSSSTPRQAKERALALEVADMDVTDDRSVHACVDGVLRAADHIDVVINNAGRGSIGPIPWPSR